MSKDVTVNDFIGNLGNISMDSIIRLVATYMVLYLVIIGLFLLYLYISDKMRGKRHYK